MRVTPNWLITVLLAVAYCAIVSVVWLINDVDYATVGDTADNILAGIIVPIGLGAAFLAVAASVLGWWRPAMREVPKVGPRWLIAIPIVFVMAGLGLWLAVDFGAAGPEYLLFLAAGTLLVGFSEEMLCRGLGIVGLRGSLPEVWVWFFSSLIFGLIHALNLLFGQALGPTLQQIGVAFLAGSAFYVIRRNTGFLVVAMLVHAFWDFGTLSNGAFGKAGSPWPILAFLQYVVFLLALIGLVLMLRKRCEAARRGRIAECVDLGSHAMASAI